VLNGLPAGAFVGVLPMIRHANLEWAVFGTDDRNDDYDADLDSDRIVVARSIGRGAQRTKYCK
jgi:hypothetical protein